MTNSVKVIPEDEQTTGDDIVIRVSDDDGRSWTFRPGDCFVMPAGFVGLWEVLEPAEKFYAIYEPPKD